MPWNVSRAESEPLSGHERSVPFELIDTDRALAALLTRLQSARLSRIAIDVEGENNLHRYGIHVALIQLFDGQHAWLVDPIAIRNRELLRDLMERSPWVKVWFDTASDLLAFRHSLDIGPAPILDLAIAARLLGLKGGLHALTGQPGSSSDKDRFQRANWMRRPLPRPLLEYAVSDVTHLLELADRLVTECNQKGLLFELLARSWEAQTAPRVWNPFGNSFRIPGYNRMKPDERRRADLFWRAREYYAKQHDQPPEMAVPKALLARLVELGPIDLSRISEEVRKASDGKIAQEDFVACIQQAEKDSPTG